MRFKKYGDNITDPHGCSGEYDFKISWILRLLGCRIARKLHVSECAHGIGCISGSRVTWRLITTVVVTTMSDHQAAKNTTPDQDLSRIPPRNIYLQVPAKKPCCSPVQSISRTLEKNTRTDHYFSRLTSRNIHSTLQNTQVLLYRASKNMKKNMNKTELLATHLCHHQAAKNTTAAKILCCPPVQSI